MKLKKMSWCLSEALLDEVRAFLRKAASIGIRQDAAAPRLLIRFAAASETCESRRGVLGVAVNFGTTSNDIKNATVSILHNFCTRRWMPPGRPAWNPTFNGELYQHLVDRVRLFDADAASDEQRAGRVLSARVCGVPPVFTNMQVIVRDKSHASRRCHFAKQELIGRRGPPRPLPCPRLPC